MQKKLKVGCAVRQNVHFHDVSGHENRHFDAQHTPLLTFFAFLQNKRKQKKIFFLFKKQKKTKEKKIMFKNSNFPAKKILKKLQK